MKRFLAGVGVLLGFLLIVILVNTFQFTSKQPAIDPVPPPPLSPQAIAHLQEGITYRTVSFDDRSLLDSTQFNAFHEFLKRAYPLVHEKLTLEKIASYSLLYRWEGKDPSLNPFVLMAHQDVVPIEESSKHLWTVDPFAGTRKEGAIWGRGATDDKVNVIGILETVEKLLGEGFQPKRTIYLAFGHDEEVGGTGAIAMAAHLKAKAVTADMVLDEGGIITKDKVPGITRPVALIGTSEKGFLSLQLTVEKNGGHSSMPENETALDILSKAIVKIREQPFDASFSPSTRGFLGAVGPEMPFLQRMVFANTWLFESVVIGIYEQSPGGNAVVRTTAVPTIIQAGMKDNVVPSKAQAIVNFRLLPGDSAKLVIRRVGEIIGDERVKLEPVGGFIAEASSVTPEDGMAFKLVEETVHKTFDDVISTPFMMIGGTDSRHFEVISKNIIKFSPMIDPIGFHGIDERITEESLQSTLWFYEQLIRADR